MKISELSLTGWLPEEGDPVRNMPAKDVTVKSDWKNTTGTADEDIVYSPQQVLTEKGAKTLLARRIDVVNKTTKTVQNSITHKTDVIPVQPLREVLRQRNFGHVSGSFTPSKKALDSLDDTPW